METIRERMISTALKNGFIDFQTIELSQNLDQLLNRLISTDSGLNCTAI
ncbi:MULTISPECIES: Spo0E family sporulation regulatory protein-aspartic acid phosphatase [Peribacillus]|nr:aspartyl-phosphate phosphatase Spo0E family protein [Peribacillus sp. TH16]MBK5501758.1 aspartyl-phosphate phosphatase Spo0E family protein [Peribacillus sp. TH14]